MDGKDFDNNSQGGNTKTNGASQNSNSGSDKKPSPKMTNEMKNLQNNLVMKERTRSSAKGVLNWSVNDNLSKTCRIAACTVQRIQGGDPMPSPFAPTVVSTAENADPSLYLKVTWQSIAHLFSYYMDGTEQNVKKVLHETKQNVKKFVGETNSNKDEIEEEEEEEEAILGVAYITEEKKGIAEEDLENGGEVLEITDRSTEITSNRNRWPTMPKFTKGKIVYIPIAFLHALVKKEKHPWLKLDSMRGAPPDGLILDNGPLKFAKSVELFTKEDTSGSNASFSRQEGSLWVALRDGNGRLIFCLHDSSWNWYSYQAANRLKIAWRAALGAITPPSRASGGKPPRYQTVPVGELKIKITAEGKARWQGRTGGAEALFETFIAEINRNLKADDTKVSLCTEDGIPSDYRLLSEDPFGLYRTYISSEGYNRYMNFLLLGAVPIEKQVDTYRPLRETIDTSAVPGNMETETDESLRETIDTNAVPENMETETDKPPREIIDTRALPRRLKKPRRLEKTEEVEEDEAVENGNQNKKDKIIPLNSMRINQRTMKDRDKNDTNGPRNKGRDAIKKGDIRRKAHEPSSGDIQTLTVVSVNARKITLAKGKRKSESRDQKAVMAASAPVTARQLLNWQWVHPEDQIIGKIIKKNRSAAYKTNEMFNGLYIAEWLHLSAYSWGGLADPQPDPTEEGIAGSSQVHSNFVLGTSETNSVMTRWEKAWQDLIAHEGDLLTAAGGDGGSYGGQLTIIRHPFRNISPPKEISEPDQNKGASSTEIQGPTNMKTIKPPGPHDDGDKYKQKPKPRIPLKTGTTVFASFPHDVAYAPSKENPDIIRWAPRSTVLDKELQRVAKEFRWVCYQFDYDLHINAPSKILMRNGFRGRAQFHPFRRMLYHKIERDLDAKVWKVMLNEALKKDSKTGKTTTP